MAWRQLPDGTFFDPNTGDLRGLDGAKEAAARAQSIRAGHFKPAPRRKLPAVNQPSKFPPLPANKFVVLPGIKGPQAIIDPKRDVLALNPYELGMGEMSPTVKRVVVTGGILAVAGAAIWIMRKTSLFGGGKKSKR
jgi:hypothetical protein